MRFAETMAPARRSVRAGAILLLLVVATACDRVPGVGSPRVLELLNDTIELADSVKLVEVTVSRTEAGDFDPSTVEARSGDVVRFTSADHGSHAIAFERARLDSAGLDFLQRTGQLRSPPLLSTDASWIITLDGASPGQYPFRCNTHSATGLLVVTPR